MNKALWIIFAAFFVLSPFAFGAEKTASPAKANAPKAIVVKAAKMHATGKVIEISNEFIKIERALKGDVETMEFTLEKPTSDILINDLVKIDYTETDGRLIASRVSKDTSKSKEIKSPETKPVSGKK